MPVKPKNPIKQSRARRTETIKFLTLDEAKRLFSVIDSKRDKAIFLLAYRHGLRASEVGLLRKADIDLKTLRVMIHRKKGSLSGEYPLQADEVKALKAYLKTREDSLPYLFPSRKGSPIGRGMLDVLIKGYGEKAKIPEEKRHFHVLKHSIATHLLEKGAELRFLQDRTGWDTRIYRIRLFTRRWFLRAASRKRGNIFLHYQTFNYYLNIVVNT